MAEYLIKDTTLTSIADAIREKTGKNDLLTLDQMATEIASIETGGSLEPITITGQGSYRFMNDMWNWVVEDFGDKITTVDLTSASRMFYGSENLKKIPFELNFTEVYDFSEMFRDCASLEQTPVVRDAITYRKNITSTKSMFSGCTHLKEIPYDFFYTLTEEKNWSAMARVRSDRSYMFASCNRLRKLPNLTPLKSGGSYTQSLYYHGFSHCRSLDEITGLIISSYGRYPENAFVSTFETCGHLKNLTFEVASDGTPISIAWSNQTIDLSLQVGYIPKLFLVGVDFDASTEVTDDASYQALKDNPDWWTSDIAYSRYNHDSAVATINSLPNVSAGSANTIKFSGESGSATDGGAINTLTAEEIAVATAKGWTVSLV